DLAAEGEKGVGKEGHDGVPCGFQLSACLDLADAAHPSSDPASPARHSSVALMAFSPPIVPLARLAKGRLEVSLKGRRGDCRTRFGKSPPLPLRERGRG